MTLWENVWQQVAKEMPRQDPRPKSWGGFIGATLAALVIIAIWFPIRLIHEILKAIDLSEKPDHTKEAQQLFREAYSLSLDLPSKSEFARSVLERADLPRPLHDAFFEAFRNLYAENMMLTVPPIPADLEHLDGIRWRDRMRREIARMRARRALSRCVAPAVAAVEASTAALPEAPRRRRNHVAALDPGQTRPASSKASFARSTRSSSPRSPKRYIDNTYRISGVPRGKYAKPPKLDEPHHLDDPSPFLEGTPFAGILATPLPVDIPPEARTSHHWIVAGTGAGKTTALQYFIAKDLERAVRGECSIVILDSQRQLVEELWSLKLFAPGQPLDGKLCILDAADIEYPIAINLFDMHLDRLASLSPLDRERLTNSALEMYDFIIGSLLQAEMTSRQSTLFRFVTRAMFAIPNATINTFHDILKDGPAKYQQFIDTLDDTARRFFATDFNSNAQFKQPREQVTARLWAVLGNQTFLRMFSSQRSKIDFFTEINTPGKVILINAEKGLLKEEGTELFGRFFLALINQAAAQRSTIPAEKRLPCYVYVDECHNYIKNDPKIQVIFAEARQQKVGVILAHQFLGQIDPPVRAALNANTGIKMAARLDAADRSAMARDMNTVPDFIRDQTVGSFAVFMRDPTPTVLSMRFPPNPLSRFTHMRADEQAIVRDRNRTMYARRVPASDTPGEPPVNAAAPPPSGRSGKGRDPERCSDCSRDAATCPDSSGWRATCGDRPRPRHVEPC